MAAPFAPFAGIALKYVAIAAAGFVLARRLPNIPPDPRVETAMDEMPEGIGLSAGDDASRARMRWRRTLRLGAAGLKFDAALLARLRVARA